MGTTIKPPDKNSSKKLSEMHSNRKIRFVESRVEIFHGNPCETIVYVPVRNSKANRKRRMLVGGKR